MTDNAALRERVRELGERDWDVSAIEKRYKKLLAEGIPGKKFDRNDLLKNKQEILDRVQQRADGCLRVVAYERADFC